MPTREIIGAVALYGLLLNAIWEYAHFLPFYTCWERWSTWQKIFCPPVAILGDVVIVLGVVGAAFLLVGPGHLFPPDAAGWGVLLGVGFVASLLFEWAALELKLWRYKPAMPTLPAGRHKVGFSPILQITLLPAASVFLAAMFSLR